MVDKKGPNEDSNIIHVDFRTGEIKSESSVLRTPKLTQSKRGKILDVINISLGVPLNILFPLPGQGYRRLSSLFLGNKTSRKIGKGFTGALDTICGYNNKCD